MIEGTPYGRAVLANEISPGCFALSRENDEEFSLLFGLDPDESGGATLVLIRNVDVDGAGHSVLLARYGTHADLHIERNAWVLPGNSRIQVVYSSLRPAKQLYERRQASLVLNKEGKLFCGLQSGMWLDFYTAALLSEPPGKEPSLLEFGSWNVISGDDQRPTKHFSAAIDANSVIPLAIRRSM